MSSNTQINWSRHELKIIGLDFVSSNNFQLMAWPINLCIGLNESNFLSKLGQMIDDPLYGHKYAIMNFWTLLLSFLLVLVLYERWSHQISYKMMCNLMGVIIIKVGSGVWGEIHDFYDFYHILTNLTIFLNCQDVQALIWWKSRKTVVFVSEWE